MSRFSVSPRPGGPITGSGDDSEGHFEITGSVDKDSLTARFKKTYPQNTNISVEYTGQIINNKEIQGSKRTQRVTFPPTVPELNEFRIRPVPKIA